MPKTPPAMTDPPVADITVAHTDVAGPSPPPSAALLTSSANSTFSVTWPAGEEQSAELPIPSAPQGSIELSSAPPPGLAATTPPITPGSLISSSINPYFEAVDGDMAGNSPSLHAQPMSARSPSLHEEPNKPHTSRPASRINRAYSTPLPAQLKHFRHPSRKQLHESPSLVVAATQPMPRPPPNSDNLSELALELADSVQMVIQTLIQISPPHLLDPAKEQLAGCTLQLPTPSVSALLTTMKNLNYMSANLSSLSTPSPLPSPALYPLDEEDLHTLSEINSFDLKPILNDGEPIVTTTPSMLALDEFDIGEVLQSVGDVLSGMAANARVDLVLYHADVGMKHVNVRGDECGISYALCHVIRQIITTARRRDEIEVGLFISSPTAARLLREDPSAVGPASPPISPDEPLICTIEIMHKFALQKLRLDSQSGSTSPPVETRQHPQFNTLILQRLLRNVRATLQVDVIPSAGPSSRSSRTVELSFLLSPVIPKAIRTPDEGHNGRNRTQDGGLASEPTLDELASFVAADGTTGLSGLKGKKAIFHASERSSFAHHLTSYLTAWGMDVSHVPTDDGSLEATEPVLPESGLEVETPAPDLSLGDPLSLEGSKSNTSHTDGSDPGPSVTKAEPVADGPRQSSFDTGMAELAGTSFIIIDDDVSVLRKRLAQIRKLAEARLRPANLPYHMQTLTNKRPNIPHRPRSSPSVRLAAVPQPSIPGTIEEGLSDAEDDAKVDFDPLQVVVVHFTSLSNYKTVQDVIQAILYAEESPTTLVYSGTIGDLIPEVLVIPKPAGPRRFLTALHTAVSKPMVDPIFAPIATTPMSPSAQGYRGSYWGPSTTSGLGPGADQGMQRSLGAADGTASVVGLGRAGRQNSSGSNASAAGSVGSTSSRLQTIAMLASDRRSPKDHPAEHERSLTSHGPAMHQGHMYTPHPPSPLRESVEYFSVNDAQVGDSAGVLVHSPDGRPAGIFFQPQQQARDGRRTGNGPSTASTGSEMRGLLPATNRHGRTGSFREGANSMGLDAAIASVTPVTTPGPGIMPIAQRFRPGLGETAMPLNLPLADATPSGGLPPRRKPYSSTDSPTRPPLSRGSSSRATIPKLPTESNHLRKVSDGARSADTAPSPAIADSPVRPLIDDTVVDEPIPKLPPSGNASPIGLRRIGKRMSNDARDRVALASPLKKPKGFGDGIVPPINVLIVEDNPINQTILSTFMKRMKINYGTAKNGQEAIDQWRAGSYHLILMDIQMPVKDGIEATKEIRALERERNTGISPSTPPIELAESAKVHGVPHSVYRSSVIIVALTASSLKEDRVAALAAGCNDFLTKPVSMTWLNTKIIEWGSIKVLEMFQDPAGVKLLADQSIRSKNVASHLKLPLPRNTLTEPVPTKALLERPTLAVQPPSTPDLPLAVPIQSPDVPVIPEEPPLSPHSIDSEVSGEEALKKHLALVSAKDPKALNPDDTTRPVILGEEGIYSGISSTSIASVLHGIPPIAEDADNSSNDQSMTTLPSESEEEKNVESVQP